jgi:hypothetical protein
MKRRGRSDIVSSLVLQSRRVMWHTGTQAMHPSDRPCSIEVFSRHQLPSRSIKRPARAARSSTSKATPLPSLSHKAKLPPIDRAKTKPTRHRLSSLPHARRPAYSHHVRTTPFSVLTSRSRFRIPGRPPPEWRRAPADGRRQALAARELRRPRPRHHGASRRGVRC